MVYFLLTCARDCKEICKVALIPADPVHIHPLMGLELANEVSLAKTKKKVELPFT